MQLCVIVRNDAGTLVTDSRGSAVTRPCIYQMHIINGIICIYSVICYCYSAVYNIIKVPTTLFQTDVLVLY